MCLKDALMIGKDCALHTVGEAILNIDLHATQIFSYEEMDNELKELHSEWTVVKQSSKFTMDSSIHDVMSWISTNNYVGVTECE